MTKKKNTKFYCHVKLQCIHICWPVLFLLSPSLSLRLSPLSFIRSAWSRIDKKCTSDWHSIYIPALTKYLCERCKHKYTAYLHFVCRQSILKMPLWPLLVFFYSSDGFCLFSSSCMYFGSFIDDILFLNRKKICHAPLVCIDWLWPAILDIVQMHTRPKPSGRAIMKNVSKSILLT